MSEGAQIPFYQIDAFTDSPFSGNPAAVCLLDSPLSAETMQAIAAEMNLSETAFVQPSGADGSRRLQWFTPRVEVPLCGHATLATAHVLLREVGTPGPLRFDTLSGILEVVEAGDGWIRMDFPADRPVPASPPLGLLGVLGCPPGAGTFQGQKAWVVRVREEEDVRRLAPDFTALERVEVGPSALGVIVTAPGAEEADFVSRFFGPWVGVDEDPVTGMAHTLLTPYWVAETGKVELLAEQISARGGKLRVRLAGERVHVSGQAVTVLKGEISIP
jgi:PhzF family phenazine biosynthesis protein